MSNLYVYIVGCSNEAIKKMSEAQASILERSLRAEVCVGETAGV